MRVILQRNFYTGEQRIRANGTEPVEIPDKYRDQLPSTAVEVDKDGNPVKKPTKEAKADAKVAEKADKRKADARAKAVKADEKAAKKLVKAKK